MEEDAIILAREALNLEKHVVRYDDKAELLGQIAQIFATAQERTQAIETLINSFTTARLNGRDSVFKMFR